MAAQIQLVGNLGRDAESKFLPDGTGVTQFSVAVSKRKKKRGEYVQETSWFDVVAFRLSEKFIPLLTKGTTVFVSGEPEIRSYETKDGTTKKAFEITANRVELVGGKSKGDEFGQAGGVPF